MTAFPPPPPPPRRPLLPPSFPPHASATFEQPSLPANKNNNIYAASSSSSSLSSTMTTPTSTVADTSAYASSTIHHSAAPMHASFSTAPPFPPRAGDASNSAVAWTTSSSASHPMARFPPPSPPPIPNGNPPFYPPPPPAPQQQQPLPTPSHPPVHPPIGTQQMQSSGNPWPTSPMPGNGPGSLPSTARSIIMSSGTTVVPPAPGTPSLSSSFSNRHPSPTATHPPPPFRPHAVTSPWPPPAPGAPPGGPFRTSAVALGPDPSSTAIPSGRPARPPPLPPSTPTFPPASSSTVPLRPPDAPGPPPGPPPYPNGPTRGRIDVTQLPRPVGYHPLRQDPTLPVYTPRAALFQGPEQNQVEPPPPAHLRYYVTDEGNASPDVLRSSMYMWPRTRSTWHATGDIPLAVLCMPLALPSQDAVIRPRKLLPPVLQTPEDANHNDTATPSGSTTWPQQQESPREEVYSHPQAVPVQILSPDQAPPRCGRCQAYLNPFFGNGLHIQDGVCNLCGSRNRHLQQSASSWVSNNNNNNNNNNGSSSTTTLAMTVGTLEYTVAGPYVTRTPPVQPVWMVALDITGPRFIEYLTLLSQVAQDWTKHLRRQQVSARQGSMVAESFTMPAARIGLCLVSSAGIVLPNPRGHSDPSTPEVHSVRPGISSALSLDRRYVIMSDVTEEPFCPLPLSSWTFDLVTEDGEKAWQAWIGQLMQDGPALRAMAKQKNAYGLDGLEVSCGGAALAFLSNALAETGGRGTWISWRRPNFGVGKLSHREEKILVDMEPDLSLLTPLQLRKHAVASSDDEEDRSAQFYRDLGARCCQDRVALDVVIHTATPSGPQPYMDLATLGELCRVTGGRLVWLAASQNWETSLAQELARPLLDLSGWDAVFKVRCSPGLRVKSFVQPTIGNVTENILTDSPEMELTCVLPGTCIAVELEHKVGGIPKDQPLAYIQSALLYTNLWGERRVRVSTLALRVSENVTDIYRALDSAVIMTVFLRQMANRVRLAATEDDKSLIRPKARDAVFHQCVHILASFRQNDPAARAAPPAKLILPDRLPLLPLFCMSLIKSRMLCRATTRVDRGGVPLLYPSADERAYFAWHAANVGASMALLMVYPSIYSLDGLDDVVGPWQGSIEAEATGPSNLPVATVPPSIEFLSDDGVYLVDDGLRFYLYIGKLVSEERRNQLLRDYGNNPVNGANTLLYQLQRHASSIAGSETSLRPTICPLLVVMQRHEGHQAPLEHLVLQVMVDDAIVGERDYNDFLGAMHRVIRERLQAK